MASLRLDTEEWQSVLDVLDAAIVAGDGRACLQTAAADIAALLGVVTAARTELGDERGGCYHDCRAAGCELKLQRYRDLGCHYQPMRELEL